MASEYNRAELPSLDKTVDVVCPHCGGRTLIECSKVVRYIPFGRVDIYRGRVTVVCEKNDESADWDNDEIDYSSGEQAFAYSCQGCGHEWPTLEAFVEEMASPKVKRSRKGGKGNV